MKELVVAIHQPNYLAYPGFFDKWDRADLFVLLDHVPYSRSGWQNRNYVRGPNGPLRLTVPVVRGAGTPIAAARIAPATAWQRKHRTSLALSYGRAPCFPFCEPLLDELYRRDWHTLGELGVAGCRAIAGLLGITTPSVTSGELGPFDCAKTDLLVEICRRVGATAYLSGDGAAVYIDAAAFDRAGIELRWQGYRPPVYAQHPARGDFVAGLSIVDMAANLGQATLDRLRLGRAVTRPGKVVGRG
ncbi:WbqC family protein [Streptomyces sp. NPDC059629]|uniref:WbqC family protein n=1 Tax=Streptomyces sp. NPDC059629 TaxID=3346889 RepID=UPI0036B76B68